MNTGDQYARETETGDPNGQRALLACSQPEDANEKRIPPEWKRALNVCGH